MNILYFIPAVLPNRQSHAVQVLNFCHALAEAGAHVELIVKRLKIPADELLREYGLEPHPRLRIRTLSPGSKSVNRWSGRVFRLRLRTLLIWNRLRHRRVILYLRGTTRTFRLLDAARPLCRRLRIPVVYEVHQIQYRDLREQHRGRFGEGEDLERYIERRRAAERRFYNQVDGFVAISRRLSEMIETEFGVARPTVIAPSGTRPAEALPDPANSTSDHASAGRDLDLCYVGGLYAFNGVDLLIEALAALPGRRLLIVGGGTPGERDALNEAAARMGVSDRIDFTGFVPHTRALAEMRRARVVVAPLRPPHENHRVNWCSPGKLMEYMASGAAIVASGLPSIAEVLRDGENAVLVEPGSAEALAEGLKRVLDDPDFARRLADRAQRDVAQFTFDARARRVLDFLEKL